MKARQHTDAMLRWWQMVGVERADLALRRPCGTMIWHRDCRLDSLAVSWARAENARQGEVYIRPARGYPWPLVFLDDLAVPTALQIAGKYDALVVQTSAAGGCHVWLSCSRVLDEGARHQAQKQLARLLGADPGSTSGEHLGRLAGFKNWKRGGTWVNVLGASRRGQSWAASGREDSKQRAPGASTPGSVVCRQTGPSDTSESGREWGWVCGLIEAGCDPRRVYDCLVEQAMRRRGKDAERYARRTVNRALYRRKGVTMET